MWKNQLNRLRKIALALVCICLCVFTSACQGNGRSPVNSLQITPSPTGAKQSATSAQGFVVRRQSEATSTPTPTVHTTLNSGSPFTSTWDQSLMAL